MGVVQFANPVLALNFPLMAFMFRGRAYEMIRSTSESSMKISDGSHVIVTVWVLPPLNYSTGVFARLPKKAMV